MAARRLLIIMLVLLGFSSVMAFVLPNVDRDRSDRQETEASGTTGETSTPEDRGPTGTTGDTDAPIAVPADRKTGGNQVQVIADRPGSTGASAATVQLDSKDPVELKLKPGSRLILTVESKTPSQVEIEGLGHIGFADQYAPAVFDLALPGESADGEADSAEYSIKAPGQEPSATIVVAP